MPKIFTCLFLFIFSFSIAQNNSNVLQNPIQTAQNFEEYQVIKPSTSNLDVSLRNIASDIQPLAIDYSVLQEIQADQPEFIRFSLLHQGDTLAIKLQRHQILSEDFQVRNQDDQPLNYNPGLYYRGKVNGDQESFVVFNFFNESLNGVISQRKKGNRIIGKLKSQEQYIIYSDNKMAVTPDFTCDVNDFEQVQNLPSQNEMQTFSQSSANCVRIFYELTNNIYLNNNSSVSTTTNWITSVYNIVATLYADANIPTSLSDVLIWQQPDPYTGSNNEKLNYFRQNRNAINGDIAHLIDLPVSGGVAYLNSLCQNNRYAFSGVSMNYAQLPTYSWTVNVVAHEMGHSVGSPHTHSCFWNGDDTAIDSCGPAHGYSVGCDNGPIPPNGGTIMSYCHLDSVGVNLALGFHPQVASYIDTNVTTKSCLGTDCINSCMQTIANLSVAQNDLNSLTIHIDDVIANSWDYRIFEQNTTPGNLITTSNTAIDINNVQPATYYVIQVANNCSNGNYGGAFQISYLSDADWCSGFTFTDTGGLNGDYHNNENFIKTFYPNQPNKKLKLAIDEFITENNYDIMTIYDGESTDASVFSNAASLSGAFVPQLSFQATNPAGAITVKFTSDGAVTAAGWKFSLTCETLSTEEFTAQDIKLYPNPFSEYIIIQSNFPIDDYVIYNMNGQQVDQQKLSSSSKTEINLNNLSSGIYLIKITSHQSTITKRLIKK